MAAGFSGLGGWKTDDVSHFYVAGHFHVCSWFARRYLPFLERNNPSTIKSFALNVSVLSAKDHITKNLLLIM